ncbi:hypothetical protein DERF_008307 [Dermatophagoides farinae]|uniref:Uncharacterized protein n=1 Tax=Dermatophagoides farinae TaxID=6954 RepID=A0A922HZP1_DERFA|nr:hypothetical protein DERF_008307 [Dermatophagoides farinae]
MNEKRQQPLCTNGNMNEIKNENSGITVITVGDNNDVDDNDDDDDDDDDICFVRIRHLRYGSLRCNAYRKQPPANACIVNINTATVSINKLGGNQAIIGTVNNDR